MTDRSEIERLLNQTGRTLECIPNKHSMAELADAARRPEMSLEVICQQSDVIELLVGALRDALDKPMQKPLTLEEAINSEWTVWVEINGWTNPRAGDVWASIRLEGYAMFAFVGESIRSHAAMNQYGKGWRCWASRPTDEERKSAAWES